MADKYAQFNAHQEDVRRRVDSLARALFVLSGGALTISIGLFTNTAAPALDCPHQVALKFSWLALFFSILLVVVTLVVIIARDYAFGERWRKLLNGQNADASGTPGWPDVVIWVLGLGGLVAFVAGMCGLAYVALGLIR